MQKSCSNMSSLFDKMGKTLAKISAHIDIVNFNDKIDEKKGDITSLIVSFQGYKGLFDQFGSSVTSTSATSATPLSLMTTISAKLTSLNTIA